MHAQPLRPRGDAMNGRQPIILAVLALAVLVVAVLALGGSTTEVVTGGHATQRDTVTASGTGQTAAAPDTAEMTFGATVQADNAKTALDQASAAADAITKAVKKTGVPA